MTAAWREALDAGMFASIPGALVPKRTPYPKPLLGWPCDRPTPSAEQWAAAERRYITTCEVESESYWNMGLRYVMATYDRLLWLGFFFPEEEAQFRWLYESGQHYVEKRRRRRFFFW